MSKMTKDETIKMLEGKIGLYEKDRQALLYKLKTLDEACTLFQRNSERCAEEYEARLKAEYNKRECLKLLTYLKIPAEEALKQEPLHEAGTPSGNIKVEWFTSFHTLHELLRTLEDSQ